MSDLTRKDLDEELEKLKCLIDEKVSWKHFTWIVSTIIGLYLVISGAIWFQLQNQCNELVDMGRDVTAISTVLQQAEITK